MQEEFCYPVECLALTVEEVMHIRQVLVKAELEKFQQYREVYNALKKGKVRRQSYPPPPNVTHVTTAACYGCLVIQKPHKSVTKQNKSLQNRHLVCLALVLMTPI